MYYFIEFVVKENYLNLDPDEVSKMLHDNCEKKLQEELQYHNDTLAALQEEARTTREKVCY